MTDINELNDRMDSNDEIIESLVKKATELEKIAAKVPEINIPDYSLLLDTIIKQLDDIQVANNRDQDTKLLDTINAKLAQLPKTSRREIRLLLFPETNQGQYYKIVFGRLIPWGLCFVAATYIFITGYKAIEILRYNHHVSESAHYERAWIYLQQHARKKTLSAMDEAYKKTNDK